MGVWGKLSAREGTGKPRFGAAHLRGASVLPDGKNHTLIRPLRGHLPHKGEGFALRRGRGRTSSVRLAALA